MFTAPPNDHGAAIEDANLMNEQRNFVDSLSHTKASLKQDVS